MKKVSKSPLPGLLLPLLLGGLSVAGPVSAQEDAGEGQQDAGEAQQDEADGQAAVDSGIYLEASGGSTRSLDQDASFRTPFGGISGDVDFKAGYQFGGALGLRINQIRFELAAQYRTADVEGGTLNGVGFGTDGEIDVLSGFFDVIYDFEFDFPVVPYLGAGIGVARLDMKAVERNVLPPPLVIDDVANEFAWNLLAGLSIAIAPGTEFFIGYRRVQLFDDVTFDAEFPGLLSGDFEMDYSTNEFSGGLRYTF